MRSHSPKTALLAGLVLLATMATAHAQAGDEEHDAHHPDETQAGAESQPAAEEGSAPGGEQGMPGMMGMMTPEMMRMMQGMMTQHGGAGEHGPAMRAAMMCPMMQFMAGMRAGSGMSSMMGDHGMLYGMQGRTPEEMTPERVREFLERRLERHGNPRLEIGEISAADDGTIRAEIVTVDGSLVQALAFNRYPGLFRQVR